MKNEPITLLVDATGKNARPVNPHPKPVGFTGGTPITMWNEFENTVKYLPLTTSQTPNSVIKGVEVWQGKDAILTKWHILNTDDIELATAIYGYDTRKAYHPLPIEEKEQVKEEGKWTAIEETALNYVVDKFTDIYSKISLSTQTGFIDGYNHAVTSNNLVSLDKVIEVVNENIDFFKGKLNWGATLTKTIAKAEIELLELILTQLKTLK